MIIKNPSSVEEVLQILSNHITKNKIIAGGTDIIPGFHINSPRFTGFDVLVDINGIKEISQIIELDSYFSIGSSVTFSHLQASSLVREKLPVLYEAASGIGNKQIRNRATIAGNFINNAPCADSVPALLVYDAQVVVKSIENESIVSLQDFLEFPYKTILKNDEIITEIRIPKKNAHLIGSFYKLGRRRAVAISRISLAVLGSVENGIFTDFRLASGAITPIGMRFKEIESFILGKGIDRDLLKEVAVKTGSKILEITGLRWSTPHKLPVLQKTLYQLLVNNFLENDEK
ncbi:MAG: FAD binding domain-containing protein [Bacteroidetes bacterium]|nr:FAD binding domain-containing protein [Bacteroidota bacterium]